MNFRLTIFDCELPIGRSLVADRLIALLRASVGWRAGRRRGIVLCQNPKIETAEAKVTAEALFVAKRRIAQATVVAAGIGQDVDRQPGGIECGGGSCFAESIPICSCGWKRSGWRRPSKDRAKLEQRLLERGQRSAVGAERTRTVSRSDAAIERSDLRYLKTSTGGDAKARMDLEAQLRSTMIWSRRSSSSRRKRSRV